MALIEALQADDRRRWESCRFVQGCRTYRDCRVEQFVKHAAVAERGG